MSMFCNQCQETAKNTHKGLTLPGFMTLHVFKIVQDKFGVQTITTVEEDKKIFGLN